MTHFSQLTETPLPTQKRSSFKSKQLSVSLDEIFEKYSLPKPNKIKIDVDGNEDLIFKGGLNTIKNCDEIYIEDNGLNEDKNIIIFLNENNFVEKEKILINKKFETGIFNRIFVKSK